MSSNFKLATRTLVLMTLSLAWIPALSAQVPQPGLQPGLTRAPDSARKISLDEAVAMAQRNAPAAVQAEGQERTTRAAKTAAIGAIFPSASLNLGRTIQ